MYVSWNGATEVARWNLYKTTSTGRTDKVGPVAFASSSGFETRLEMDGYAAFVVVEALDQNGLSLGKSNISRTIVSPMLSDEVLEQEEIWLGRVASLQSEDRITSTLKPGNTAAGFCGGFAFAVAMVFAVRCMRRRQKRALTAQRSGPSYELVDRDDGDEDEDGDDDVKKTSKSSL